MHVHGTGVREEKKKAYIFTYVHRKKNTHTHTHTHPTHYSYTALDNTVTHCNKRTKRSLLTLYFSLLVICLPWNFHMACPWGCALTMHSRMVSLPFT